MRTVFVLFDTLNRSALSPYCDRVTNTPQFARFAERAITFDTHYACGLPCMPARRDMHTGRPSFLHRNWGPLEPFDNSFPEILKNAGNYSHLVTDHHHYFSDGGATYHTRYSSWELFRGNGIDKWMPVVEPDHERFGRQYHGMQVRPYLTQDLVNRDFIQEEEDFSTVKTINAGMDFIRRNHAADNWFLQIESFDPHEPFVAPDRFKRRHQTKYEGPTLDWPPYARLDQTQEEIDEIRANYQALVEMCDHYFGKILDMFDEHDMWKDTILIVTTDHGFLLGEHDWWGKNIMPVYDEQARIPLFIHHPDFTSQAGTRRSALTQTIDLMPTFLESHGIEVPDEVRGASLLSVMDGDRSVREAGIYGYFGAACNVTDGRFTYFRYPDDMSAEKLFEYTLMPTRMHSRFPVEQLQGATLHPPFDFSKGLSTLKVRPMTTSDNQPSVMQGSKYDETETVLYDTQTDPLQAQPIDRPEVVDRLTNAMRKIFADTDVPSEVYERFGVAPLSKNEVPDAGR